MTDVAYLLSSASRTSLWWDLESLEHAFNTDVTQFLLMISAALIGLGNTSAHPDVLGKPLCLGCRQFRVSHIREGHEKIKTVCHTHDHLEEMESSEPKDTKPLETTSEETRTPTPAELEEGGHQDRHDKEHEGSQSNSQSVVVDWDGPQDPMNPRK